MNIFSLANETVAVIKAMTPRFGYNGFGEIVYYTKYSRTMPNGQQEHWADTVIRVIEGVFSIRKSHMLSHRLPWDERAVQYYARQMAVSLFNLEWSPPGRGLWAMGTNMIYERGAMALYNCAATTIDKEWISDLHWFMDCMMYGVGVGFSPIRDDSLRIPQPVASEVSTYTIPDSREGWCDSVSHLLDCIRLGVPYPVFDYSHIRSEGEPLKTFGGTASGPAPLIQLHERIVSICEAFSEGRMDSVQFKTDLANCIGCCVVAGNIRRGAEIGLAPISDPTFAELKDYKKYPERAAYGWMSNNSVTLWDKSDYDMLGRVARGIIHNGEPGIANLKNFKYGRIGDREFVPDRATLLNPCVVGESTVLTPDGPQRIDSLVVGDKIWSETGWTTVTAFYDQGIKPVYKYSTTAGELTCTEDHKLVCDGFKIKAKDTYGIDVLRGPERSIREDLDYYYVIWGLVVGDGSNHHDYTILYVGQDDQDYFNSPVKSYLLDQPEGKTTAWRLNTHFEVPPIIEGRSVPDEVKYGNRTVVRSFLRGLYTANGCVVNNTIRLKTISKTLVNDVQVLLSTLGIRSFYTTNKVKNVEFANGIYECKEAYDIVISVDRGRFQQEIGFEQHYKNEKLNTDVKIIDGKTTYELVSVEPCGEQQVYDITVDNYCHTFWCNGLNVSNCGEIPLENKEVCNLAITCPTRCPDTGRWLRACEYATFYASTVTLLPTHSVETNDVVSRNRRIGIDILDYAGWKEEIGTHALIKALRGGYKRVRLVNKKLARQAGIPVSIRVTTMKPNGTVSKIVGRSPSHPNATYMLRRIRIAKNTPAEQILMEAGIPHEPCAMQPDFTTVFEYPIYNGELREVQEVSLWEQASNLVLLQREWADNSVSNTLYFGEDEAKDVEHVLSSIVPVTKSISMMAHDNAAYPQMPEERITPAEYHARLSTIESIDWSNFRGDGEDEKYCSAAGCSI